MQRWVAADDSNIHVKAWFGGGGLGAIRLSVYGTDEHLASNPGPGETFEFDLPADTSPDLYFTVVAASGDLPFFVELSQNGHTLLADNGVDPLNEEAGGYGPVPCGTIPVNAATPILLKVVWP